MDYLDGGGALYVQFRNFIGHLFTFRPMEKAEDLMMKTATKQGLRRL